MKSFRYFICQQNELKELQDENRRYKDELEKRHRRTRDKQPTVAISDTEMEAMPRKIQALSKELEDTGKKKEELITNLEAITTASQMIEKINKEHESDLQEKRKKLDDITERRDFVKIAFAFPSFLANIQNSFFAESIKEDDKEADALKAQKEELLSESEQIDKDFEDARLE
ncbi:hypothetical protein OS493_031727, partial [Desmophyllum pertusum]